MVFRATGIHVPRFIHVWHRTNALLFPLKPGKISQSVVCRLLRFLELFEKCQNEFYNVTAYSLDIFLKINKMNLSLWYKQLTVFTASGKNSSFQKKIRNWGEFVSSSVSMTASRHSEPFGEIWNDINECDYFILHNEQHLYLKYLHASVNQRIQYNQSTVLQNHTKVKAAYKGQVRVC